MNLQNRCKNYRDKSVQLTITSIIISHTYAPLQLCIVAPNHNLHCDDTDGEHKNGVGVVVMIDQCGARPCPHISPSKLQNLS